MFNALATLLALTLALHPVFAGVYLTSPVGTTTATGGQVLNVQWGERSLRLDLQ
jgi:hypothetical protein